MGNQHITKEELLKKYQLLEHEYNCSKASFKKEISELKLLNDHMESKMLNSEAIFESSPVAMLIIDETTNIVMVNVAAIKMCGGKKEEILQHRPGNALHCMHSAKDSRGCGYATDCKTCKVRNKIEALIAHGGSVNGDDLEFTIIQNEAPQKVWMKVGVEPLLKDGQKLWCIAMHDITEQKRTEHQLIESQTLFHSIIDSTSDMIWSVDADNFGLLTFNQAFADYFLKGLGIHVVKGMRPEEMLPTTDSVNYWYELYQKGMSGVPFETDYQMLTSNRTLTVSIHPLLHDHVLAGLSVFAKDVTAQKQAEERIRLSEEKFRAAFMTTKDGFYIGTLNEGMIIEINPGFENIFQYTPEESIGRTSTELGLWTVPEDRVIMVSQLKEKGYCNNLETVGRKKNGALFHVSITTSILTIDQVPHIVGVIRDITEQKLAALAMIHAKEKIEESEIRFKAISEQAMDGITLADLDGNFIFANKAFCKMTGYSEEEVLVMNVDDFKGSSEAHAVVFPEVKRLGSKSSRDNQLQCKDHSIIYVDINGKKITIDNKPLILGIIRDVSERVIKENELIAAKEKAEQSEYRLKLATASGQLGIWDWNLVENSMIWDERMFELYGITRETFPNNFDAWINGLHPEDKQRALDECNAALTGEREFNTSFRVLHPDGCVLYLKGNGSVIRDENGKPLRMIGINRDITENRLAAMQLVIEKNKAVESEMVFRKLFEDSSDGQLLFSKGKFTNCNKAALKLLGTDRATDIIGLSPAEVAPEVQPDGRPSLKAALEYSNRAYDKGYCQFEWVCKRLDEKLILVDITLMPIVLHGERHLHGTWRDITDRKKAEQALKESEERYRNLFQKSHGTMLLIDSETGAIMDANPAACSYYGWTREELLKMQLHEINTLHEAEIQAELLLARTEKRNYFIFKHRLANGSIRDVEVYSSPLVVSGKTVLYSIIHDITDRKLAEQALLESEKRIQKKLANLLSPQSDIGELALEDIIDTEAIQTMMEEFFKFTKIPVAIIDLQGKVLVGPGWQDICTKFHRIHPETLANCIECDTTLTQGIPQGSFKSYLCKNSLWDNATPMIVDGRHVGNLFTGQF
ncbi:MAG TPA: PAS domain S-box protein, partial [Prolixibacteraceae bacterium]|nr:PAS domain S-box protein [Prolixibacteraceae bacterium]